METWSRTLDLEALAERFGTPLYVLHEPTLRGNFRRWAALVGGPGGVRYPVKANPSPTVLRTLAALGSGADCASRPEVQLALQAGIPLGRLSYNTPAPELDLAAWLLRSGASVVADSRESLDRLGHELRAEELAGRLFVRVNPGGLPGYRTRSAVQRYTAHGAATSQFGVPSEELPDYLALYPLPVTGLHVHVGTQMDNLETFVEGLRFLHRLADLLAERTGHRIGTLNLGGGLGIPFADDQSFPAIEELAAVLAPELRPGVAYQVEPGNSLVGDTEALLTRVVSTKTTRGKRWAIADVGTDQLVKHTVARWEHQILGPSGAPLPRGGPDGLAGPLCFAGDVLYPETDLSGVATGDLLVIQHAGAYCEAVSSRFNGRRAPGQVVVGAGGEARLARRREDPFYEPGRQTFVPEGTTPGLFSAAGAEVLDPARVGALQSAYMHELAAEDVYEIREVRRTAPGAYVVTFDVRGAVDFVAMPFAVRLVGDATIVAVGREMGWEEKPGPVWATRLSMSCGRVLPLDGAVECRVALSPLAPAAQPGMAWSAEAHYSLGEGEVQGVAHVVVPEGAAPAREAPAAEELAEA